MGRTLLVREVRPRFRFVFLVMSTIVHSIVYRTEKPIHDVPVEKLDQPIGTVIEAPIVILEVTAIVEMIALDMMTGLAVVEVVAAIVITTIVMIVVVWRVAMIVTRRFLLEMYGLVLVKMVQILILHSNGLQCLND